MVCTTVLSLPPLTWRDAWVIAAGAVSGLESPIVIGELDVIRKSQPL